MSEIEQSELDESTVPFFPDHIGLEAKVALVFGIFVIIIGIIGLISPVGLQAPADPMDTPAHVKPEWYFLALYQILKSEYISKNLGAAIPIILVGLLILWPFIDRKPDKTQNTTRNRLITSVILIGIIIVLTIWGEVS